MKSMKSFFIVIIVALTSVSAEAKKITLGQPTYGGNGCSAGSASVAVTGDGTTMSVLFDSFSAEAGKTTGRRIDRKSCNLRIPVKVPNGFSVALMAVDYRGFNAIPGAGAYNEFRSEYSYSGTRGPVIQKRFTGPKSDSFHIDNKLSFMNLVWSACSKDVIFGINTSATSMANAKMEQTMIIVDSIDITASIQYRFKIRTCLGLTVK